MFSSDPDLEPSQSAQRLPNELVRNSGSSDGSEENYARLLELNAESSQDISVQPDSAPTSPRRSTSHRPPSTWKYQNANELRLASGLKQSVATDLSIHLFNAFRITNANLRDTAGHKRYDATREVDDSLTSKWDTPKSWTAWPLHPTVVPREHSDKQRRSLPYPYLPKPLPPSHNLRELLLAQILRQATLQFGERHWNSDQMQPSEPSTIGGSFLAPNCSPEDETSSTDGDEASNLDSSPSTSDMDNVQSTSAGPQSSERPPLGGRQHNLRPVLLADDEEAMVLAQPMIQHILAKLDKLLMGLHLGRSSYVSLGRTDENDQTETEEQSQSRSRPYKRTRSQSTRRQGYSSGVSSGPNDDDMHVQSSKRRRTSSTRETRFQKRRNLLGLRDWSDVLGVASMIGFDHAVVERAAFRCANLFDRGMQFRTMTEGRDASEEQTIRPGRNVPDVQRILSCHSHEQTRMGDDVISNSQLLHGTHRDGFLQPIQAKRSWRRAPKKRRAAKKDDSHSIETAGFRNP